MDKQLHVSFVFPGAPSVVTVHTDRSIGILCDPSNIYEHAWKDAGIEFALGSVEGIDLTSIFTRVSKHSFTTEVNLAFPRDDVCLNIALVLGEYFGTDVQIESVIDNRPLRNMMYS
ncbi:hypothetical protein B7Y94_04955 [Candidatus Saccharibacteria bacterium 32-49-12]|nr:MAG: hypothetical protein B7Y94_04955 [Candidatus Saccharibacteria bacterium 32-49-12]